MRYRTYSLFLIVLIFSSCLASAQTTIPDYDPVTHPTTRINDFDGKIDAIRIATKITANSSLDRIKLPKRRYVPEMFCNDFIPYKNGYIISSINVQPGVDRVTKYDFFYIDMKKKKLYRVVSPLVDTIYSIISQNQLAYISGIKNGKPIILRIFDKSVEPLPRKVIGQTELLGDSSWMKLAFNKDKLVVFQRNGTFQRKNDQWEKLPMQSLDEYNFSIGWTKPRSIIPSQNIRVENGNLFFMQELTQLRSALLYSGPMDSKAGITEFWTRNKLLDNTKKEIMGFDINDQRTFVTAQRLLTNCYLLSETKGKTEALLVNNYATTDKEELNGVEATSVKILGKDSLVLAAKNGLFYYTKFSYNPAILLDNERQMIQLKDHTFVYDFVPRSMVRLETNKYLLGGVFGGLYIVDIKKQELDCLDDMKKVGGKDVFGED